MTIVSFDFDLDKDKIFIGYQFVIISEFCVSSRTSSSDQEEILTGLGVHMYNVQYQVDEHQESDHQDADNTVTSTTVSLIAEGLDLPIAYLTIFPRVHTDYLCLE